MRKKCISFIFVSPVETKVKNVRFRLEAIGQLQKKRQTKFALYTRTNIALGYAYIEILDDEDYAEYEIAKSEFIEKMQHSGGLGVENYSEERIEKDYQTLLEYVKDKNPNMKKSRVLGCAVLKVRGDSRYQAVIADDVYDTLQTEKNYSEIVLEDEKIANYKDGELIIEHEFNEANAGFLNTLYKNAIILFEKDYSDDVVLHRGIEYFNQRMINGLIETEATAEVNDMIKPEVRRISMRYALSKFKENLIGYAAEDAFLEDYGYMFPDAVKLAGQGEPDFKTDGYVGEIKIRTMDDKRTPEWYIKNKCAYLKDYLEKGVLVKFALIYYDKEQCGVNVYSIKRVDIEN